MKKLINLPRDVAQEMCQGIALAHPGLQLNLHHKFLYKKNLNSEKVILISGGGAGHEPAHSGFIGYGALDCAVSGEVFASPSQIQIYEAIKTVASKQGVLLIIKNYSGDIMNFQMAAKLAREDNIVVDFVKVDDDIAVNDSLYTVGRRGVAGTVFVHKIAGAACEQLMTLSEVKRVAEKCVNSMRSIGFALSSCTPPSKGSPLFSLSENEFEYGIGIHGEPGRYKKTMKSSSELAKEMVEELVTSLSIGTNEKTKVAILVNGMGGTPLQELYIFYYDVVKILQQYDIEISFPLVGNYMTSLEMAGASLTILKLDSELESLLKESCYTPALTVLKTEKNQLEELKIPFYGKEHSLVMSVEDTGAEKSCEAIPSIFIPHLHHINDQLTLPHLHSFIYEMAQHIIHNEKYYCELDSIAGDGDFGTSLSIGFQSVLKKFDELRKLKTIGEFFTEIGMLLFEYCGGASGPLWGSAFKNAGKVTKKKISLTTKEYSEMIFSMIEAIQSTGEQFFGYGAKVGDKTLIDALIPYAIGCKKSAQLGHTFSEMFKEASMAAAKGAEATKSMVAKLGRAGVVGERSLGHVDAGAYAVADIFTYLSKKSQ